MAPSPPSLPMWLDLLIRWSPLVLIPMFGWIWHTENTIVTLSLRVSSLEEQVDNYRTTEDRIIEVKTRLEDVQRMLIPPTKALSESRP